MPSLWFRESMKSALCELRIDDVLRTKKTTIRVKIDRSEQPELRPQGMWLLLILISWLVRPPPDHLGITPNDLGNYVIFSSEIVLKPAP